MTTLSFAQYVGDGATTDFTIPCPYLNTTDIGVKVAAVVTAYTFTNSTTVHISPAPANGSIVEVRRTTPKVSPFVVFQDGSVLGKIDLNNAVVWLWYLAQECFDAVTNSVTLNALGQYDAQTHNIQNVTDPLLPQDAATKAYVDAKASVAGNVPAPGGLTGTPGYWLKALTSSTFGWVRSVAADISDASASGLSVLTGTAAAGRTALGLGTIATQAASAVAITGGTLSGNINVLTNTRLAKTGTYAAANADKGSTIALGGNAFYTLSFAGAAGFDANFSVMVVNEDSGRGKTISLAAVGTFILWPGQSLIVFNQNNVWRVDVAGQRWLKASATFYVDPLVGNDSNDGLAAGAGNAFLTIQAAYNNIRSNVDTLGAGPIIQLADGTYNVGAGVNINYALVGGSQFFITGNISTPANVIISCTAGGTCFSARDGGATVTLSGMTLSATGNGSTLLLATQNAVIDICGTGPVNFGIAPLGTHMLASTWASINVLGNYSVTGGAAAHLNCTDNGYINYGTYTVTGSSSLTITNFITASNCGVISAGGTGMTFSGFASVTAKKYAIGTNAVLDSGGATFPGGTAGTVVTGAQFV